MDNEYNVNLDVIDYQILLDKDKKIYSVKSRNRHFKQLREDSDFNTNYVTDALRIMFLYEPEQFEELYQILKENDPDMFIYAAMVVNQTTK